MKKSFFILISSFFILVSCGGGEYKRDAQGAPYEIIIVADHEQWQGAVGDSLRALLGRQVPMLNHQEPMFDVLRVLPEGFKTLVMRHRNVLILNTNKDIAEPSLAREENVYATPQTILTLSAPNLASMAAFVGKQGEDILLLLEYAEQQRDVEAAKTHTSKAVAEKIRNKFGFEMNVGSGFTIRDEKADFLWLSYEMPTASQGIIIYSYPFSGSSDLFEDNLLARRNEFTRLVPGEKPGSHMTTNPEYNELIYKEIHGRSWAELHGFWDVAGDFMGGPFVGYSTYDAANNRIVAIDMYVYAPDPKIMQRNLKNQLMHYIHTVKF